MKALTAQLRVAQPGWACRTVRERVAVIARLRRLIVAESRALAATAVRANMTEADVLVAEVIPFLAACRFLERRALRLLAPRRPEGGAPVWLTGVRLQVRRVPFGVVLILAPRNYPLLLAAVQVVQALAAGNAVLVKPAPGFVAPMNALATALRRAGLPDGLFAILPDTHEAGAEALAAGADKVVLTGGEATGRFVLRRLAETLTPATLELSGDDAVLVLPGAPVQAVARAIGYGLALNGGETCIAPRRIIAVGDVAPALTNALAALQPTLPICHVAPEEAARIGAAVKACKEAGGQALGELPCEMMRPLLIRASTPDACLPPLFGPAASILSVPDVDAAVAVANSSRFALGAAVFGPAAEAMEVALRLRAGCVTVNDLIIATADPRLPFGGAGSSGYGVTRGAEGLLEMTRPQAIAARRRVFASLFRTIPPSATGGIVRILKLLYG